MFGGYNPVAGKLASHVEVCDVGRVLCSARGGEGGERLTPNGDEADDVVGGVGAGDFQRDVEGSVRTGDYVAHTTAIFEDDLFVDDAVAFDLEAAEFLLREGAEEEVVFPLREGVAGVKAEGAHGDGGRPVADGRFKAFFLGEGRDRRAVVIHAVGDEWPAVVARAADVVEFVAAAGAVFGFPEFAGGGVNGEALGIAMAVAPDRGEGAGGVDERVVGGNASISVEAVDLAVGKREVLGLADVAAFAEGEVDVFAGEYNAAAEVDAEAGVGGAGGFEEGFLVGPASVADASADEFGVAGVALAGVAEGEVEPAVVGVVGVDGEGHEAAFVADPDGRDVGDGLNGPEFAGGGGRGGGDAAVALGEEEGAVGQEGEGPRDIEIGHDLFNAVGVVFARLGLGRQLVGVACRGGGAALGGLPDVNDEGPGFGVVKSRGEAGHADAAHALADYAGEAGVVAGVAPFPIQEAARFAAFEIGAVAVGAELSVEGGGVTGGRSGRGAPRENNGGNEESGREAHDGGRPEWAVHRGMATSPVRDAGNRNRAERSVRLTRLSCGFTRLSPPLTSDGSS